jgi:hypothetical protein
MARRPVHRIKQRDMWCLAPRRGGTHRPDERAAKRFFRRGLGLGHWGAHGHGAHVHRPARRHHGAKAGAREPEAQHAQGAWHGGGLRGGPRLDETQGGSFPNAWTRSAQQHGVAAVRGNNMEAADRHPLMGKQRRADTRRLEGALSGVREQGRGKAREERGVTVSAESSPDSN